MALINFVLIFSLLYLCNARILKPNQIYYQHEEQSESNEEFFGNELRQNNPIDHIMQELQKNTRKHKISDGSRKHTLNNKRKQSEDLDDILNVKSRDNSQTKRRGSDSYFDKALEAACPALHKLKNDGKESRDNSQTKRRGSESFFDKVLEAACPGVYKLKNDGKESIKKSVKENEIPGKEDSKMVPKSRSIIKAPENACPEGYSRNHPGKCVPDFDDY